MIFRPLTLVIFRPLTLVISDLFGNKGFYPFGGRNKKVLKFKSSILESLQHPEIQWQSWDWNSSLLTCIPVLSPPTQSSFWNYCSSAPRPIIPIKKGKWGKAREMSPRRKMGHWELCGQTPVPRTDELPAIQCSPRGLRGPVRWGGGWAASGSFCLASFQ